MDGPLKDQEPAGGEHESRVFRLWALADEQTPCNALYSWCLHSVPNRQATTVEELTDGEFVYRVGNGFVAHVVVKEGRCRPVTLQRESFGYRLVPLAGPQGLLTPEQAEEILLRFLVQQERPFWREFWASPGAEQTSAAEFMEAFRRSTWHSLRLDQPLQAAAFEPLYHFRRGARPVELRVGARSGKVSVHPADR